MAPGGGSRTNRRLGLIVTADALTSVRPLGDHEQAAADPPGFGIARIRTKGSNG
jgi:hypothetical protein